MFREEKARELGRLRQERFREKRESNAPNNKEITPPSPSPSPSPTTIKEEDIQIPLRDNSNFLIPQEKILEYQKTFSNINVQHELGMLRQWNIDNPGKRKTRGGILRHINSWLMDTEKKRIASVERPRNDHKPTPPYWEPFKPER